MKLRVVFVGNSVPLRVRPAGGKPFPVLVEEALLNKGISDLQCFNECKGATLISDGIKQIDQQVLSKNPSFIIINYGINEAATRLLPKRLDDWIYWNSQLFLTKPQRFLSLIIAFARKALNVVRPSIIKVFRLGGWAKAAFFEKALLWYIQQIDKETAANIVLITIPQVSDRIESVLPGTKERVHSFNKAIKRVAQQTSSEIIDVDSLIALVDRQICLPEGIHFSQEGHRRIADEVCARIIGSFEKSGDLSSNE